MNVVANIRNRVAGALLLACTLASVNSVNAQGLESLPAEIAAMTTTSLFTENFDATPDWYAAKAARCLSGNEEPCSNMPVNWDYYYFSERFHPDELGASFEPSGQISNLQYRGASGKSYITYDESYGGSSQWGSDATLAMDLPGNYKDIYAEYWFKFQPNYKWQAELQGNGTTANKMARFTSYNSGPDGSRFSFLHGGNNTPLHITQLQIYVNGNQNWQKTNITGTVRCSPVATNYKCPLADDFIETLDGELGSYSTFQETIGDGQWHKWGFRAKYNSADGVADGMIQAWIDNVKVMEKTNITMTETQAQDIPQGFNMFMIGGNMSNVPYDESAQYEQWLAFDDIAVYSLGGAGMASANVNYTLPSPGWTIVHDADTGTDVLCSTRTSGCSLGVDAIYRQTTFKTTGNRIQRKWLSCIEAGCTEFNLQPDAVANLTQ